MTEEILQIIESSKIAALAVFTLFYGLGGINGKWKRRILASIYLTFLIVIFSLIKLNFHWIFLSYALWVDAGHVRIDGRLTSSSQFVVDGTTTSSGAGAVGITGGIHEITTTGIGDALTLADGIEGQRLLIVYVAEGAGTDTAVLTPTNMGGGTTVTFATVGQMVLGLFTNARWYFIAQGAVIA